MKSNFSNTDYEGIHLLDDEIESWQKWFAWKPITINEKRYWFCYVYRRKPALTWPRYHEGEILQQQLNVNIDGWQYGTILDVIKE